MKTCALKIFFMKILLYFLVIIGLVGCDASDTKNVSASVVEAGANTESILQILSKKAAEDLEKIPRDSLQIPRTAESDGLMKGTPSKSWTSGFYPGMLWQLYDYSKDEKLKSAAEYWSSVVEKEKNDGGTHDLGFKIYSPFGKAYQITKNEKYKEVFLTAAKTLSTRFNPQVGAIRSWDHHEHLWKYPVIIDNMMNLEMLFESTKLTGDSTFYQVADQHAATTLKNHFRADNSSYHVVDYDTKSGEPKQKNTHQGLNHESAWSRGQAWGLYGFTVSYRYTGKQEYLEQAQKIANFIFTHPNLPADLIPYWDYDALNIPDEPRDVSAATVTASALYELAKYDSANAAAYKKNADKILESLQAEKYRCEVPPFFLKHSVGSIPGDFETDSPIIYADYYYVEALMRQAEKNI